MKCWRGLVLVVLAATAALAFWAAPRVYGYSDNCSGSSLCSSLSKNDCTTAYARYDDGTTYSTYTSRVSGHCTAIYRCDGSYPSLTGSDLKQRFSHIYQQQPCGRCGSHAFDNCEVTLNYCGSCQDVN